MNRAALLNQLARCNERIDQTDRNVFAQAKRVAAATAAGADVSISRDLEAFSRDTSRATEAAGCAYRPNCKLGSALARTHSPGLNVKVD